MRFTSLVSVERVFGGGQCCTVYRSRFFIVVISFLLLLITPFALVDEWNHSLWISKSKYVCIFTLNYHYPISLFFVLLILSCYWLSHLFIIIHSLYYHLIGLSHFISILFSPNCHVIGLSNFFIIYSLNYHLMVFHFFIIYQLFSQLSSWIIHYLIIIYYCLNNHLIIIIIIYSFICIASMKICVGS